MALLKFAVNLPFCVLITVLGNTSITILYLPVNVYYSAATIIQTPYWGCKLKVLFLLFLPAAALAPLPSVILGSIGYSIVMPLVVTFWLTFEPDQNADDEGGTKEIFCEMPIRIAWQHLFEYHQIASTGYLQYYQELTNPLDRETIIPRDIPICFLFMALLQSVCITVVVLIFDAIIIVLKVPLLLICGYGCGLYWFVFFLCDLCVGEKEVTFSALLCGLVFGPLALVCAIVAWPIALALGVGTAVTGLPLVCGVHGAIVSHEHNNSILCGFADMWNNLGAIDAMTNKLLLQLFGYFNVEDKQDLTCIHDVNVSEYANPKRTEHHHRDNRQSQHFPGTELEQGTNPMHHDHGGDVVIADSMQRRQQNTEVVNNAVSKLLVKLTRSKLKLRRIGHLKEYFSDQYGQQQLTPSAPPLLPEQLVSVLKMFTFGDDKKEAVEYLCQDPNRRLISEMNCEQIVLVLNTIPFAKNKKPVLVLLKPYITDPQNKASIVASFAFWEKKIAEDILLDLVPASYSGEAKNEIDLPATGSHGEQKEDRTNRNGAGSVVNVANVADGDVGVEESGMVVQAAGKIGQGVVVVGNGLWNVAAWGASKLFNTGEDAGGGGDDVADLTNINKNER